MTGVAKKLIPMMW